MNLRIHPLVAGALAVTVFATGWLIAPSKSPSIRSAVNDPVFVAADRALGETADDAPLRACMISKARKLIADAGAGTSVSGSIDYAKLEAFLAGPGQDDRQWDNGILNRATIPWQILVDCREGLMRPNIAVGDLDDDGLPEVLYATSDGRFRIWWNQGAGRFKPEVIAALSDDGDVAAGGGVVLFPIVLTDVDADGDIDIILSKLRYHRILTLLNTGKRTFATTVETSNSDNGAITRNIVDSSFTMLPADLDKDGLPDLVVVTRTIGETIRQSQNMGVRVRPIRIFYNTGTPGRWKERTVEAIPEVDALDLGSTDRNPGGSDPSIDTDYQRSGSYTPVVADFNNDGWPDIYVAADYRAPRLFIAREGGQVYDDRTRESKMLDENPETMGGAAIDWDDDGWMDIIATDIDRTLNTCGGGRACPARGGHRLLRNNHDFTFTDIGPQLGINDAGWGFGFSMTDLNLDGNTDVVVGTGDLSTSRVEETWGTMFQKPYLFLGNGETFTDRSLPLLRPLTAVTPMNVIVSADFDGDHRADLLLSGYENRAPYLLLNRTEGHAASVVIKGAGSSGAEGAVVRIEIKGRRPQVFVMPSLLSNFIASVTNTAIPIGLPDDTTAKVTVTFASGKVVSAVVGSGAQYVITEGDK